MACVNSNVFFFICAVHYCLCGDRSGLPQLLLLMCVKLVYMCTQVYYSYSNFVQVPVQWVHICDMYIILCRASFRGGVGGCDKLSPPLPPPPHHHIKQVLSHA